MQKTKILRNSQLLLICSLLLLIKPAEFFAINFFSANHSFDVVIPFILSFSLIIFGTIFYLLFVKVSILYIQRIIVLICSFYFLQFFLFDLIDLISNISGIPLSRKLTLFSISMLFLLALIFVKVTFNLQKLSHITYPLIFLFILQLSFFLVSFLSFLEHNDSSLEIQSMEFSDNNFKELNSSLDANVYFIILDGLVSYEYLLRRDESKENFISEFRDFNNNLLQNGFYNFPNSFSSYNLTQLTLGAIFRQEYYQDGIIHNDISSFFPRIIYQSSPPSLINNLVKIGYKFSYSGNFWSDCRPKVKIINCLERTSEGSDYSIYKAIDNGFSNPGFQTYISRSFLGMLIRRYGELNDIFYFDDGLDNFLNSGYESMILNKKNFFFIHNELPHPPYPNEKCEIDPTRLLTEWGDDFNTYLLSVSCALDKAKTAIDQIITLDKSAIIVLQGDHGPAINYDWSIHPKFLAVDQIEERFSIFNAARVPKSCIHNYANKRLGNVESINLIVNCISGSNNEINIENKSYAGTYADSEYYGSLIELTKKLD